MEGSVLESLGFEIIGVMSPVSICMLLVVLIVSAVPPDGGTPLRTAATLLYLEETTDSPGQKLQGALLNAAAFIVLMALVTFLLVLLYYYRFTHFLKYYMNFSAFFVFSSMGGPIFFSLLRRFSIPLDSLTSFLLLFNFTIVGVLSIFSQAVPIIVRQTYMVSLGIIVAAWFTKLPEWSTWVLLMALAVYDLVAVLAPGGPLKLLVELASSRDEELPALIYEARPTVSNTPAVVGLLVAMAETDSRSVELQPVSGNSRVYSDDSTIEIEEEQDTERSPLVGNSRVIRQTYHPDSSANVVLEQQNRISGSLSNAEREDVDQELSPLVTNPRNRRGGGVEIEMTKGIKLGLGDFVFYGVLVGRAAMYDLMTVYACYLAIISGLGCTLILLSVYRRALPALPISIALGVMFYFLTRLLMEPFVVGTSTNLLMF
ncbi:presenilin-like protein At1g08700 [Aristolochia californica]|uniref:presenilin-like protein At1g08700 n=1 Tax=Aristolochia californica TaxID=171875 RepID=UPI0035D9EFF3